MSILHLLDDRQKSPEELRSEQMFRLVQYTEDWYKRNRIEEDVRNVSYYRGKFWTNEGLDIELDRSESYAAQQNEIFPIMDTMVSALAMDVPAVECVDQRYASTLTPERASDPTIVGRQIAATLNWWAELEELDVTLREAVLHGLVFRRAVVKTQWSPSLGRPIWRTKLPWEVHFDPSAKRVADASWSFERFVLHWEDFQERVDAGTYENADMERLRPDTYPRSMFEEASKDAVDWQQTERGLKDYVSLIEFHDYRRRKLYHLHPTTHAVLLEAPLPYGRPYEVLAFHDSIGHIDGVSDVTLLAPVQQDINYAVSARREIVLRLTRKVIYDKKLFKNEEEESSFLNNKAVEPVGVDAPLDGRIEDHFYIFPGAETTYDFNRDLEDMTGSIRRIPGTADYERGQVTNIRTAAEATMIRSSVEGRLNIRARKVTRMVTAMFQRGLDAWQWACANPEASGIDMDRIAHHTQVDVDGATLTESVLSASPQFRVLPFSPLMEDKIVRREQLVQLAGLLANNPLVNQHEFVRELVESFGVRPSIVLSQEAAQAQAQAAQIQPTGVPEQQPSPQDALQQGIPEPVVDVQG